MTDGDKNNAIAAAWFLGFMVFCLAMGVGANFWLSMFFFLISVVGIYSLIRWRLG